MHTQPAAVESPIEIVTRGPVGGSARRRLHAELARVAEEAPRRALFVRGSLTVQQNPSIERRALATATIDLGRHVVRARVAARGTAEATDLLVDRLRRELRDLRGRREASRRSTPPRVRGGLSPTRDARLEAAAADNPQLDRGRPTMPRAGSEPMLRGMASIDHEHAPRPPPPANPQEPVELLLRDLRARPDGLSGREAERRLIAYGRNELVRQRHAPLAA